MSLHLCSATAFTVRACLVLQVAVAVRKPSKGLEGMGGQQRSTRAALSLPQDLAWAYVHEGLDRSKPDCRTEVPGEPGIVL